MKALLLRKPFPPFASMVLNRVRLDDPSQQLVPEFGCPHEIPNGYERAAKRPQCRFIGHQSVATDNPSSLVTGSRHRVSRANHLCDPTAVFLVYGGIKTG